MILVLLAALALTAVGDIGRVRYEAVLAGADPDGNGVYIYRFNTTGFLKLEINATSEDVSIDWSKMFR